MLVYENTSAVPLIAAIDRTGARMVASGRIAADDILQQLGATEPT